MKHPEELFEELGIKFDDDAWGYGRFKGRNIRYLEHRGVLQIGERDEDFDRWANSVELEFEVWKSAGQRALTRWATL